MLSIVVLSFCVASLVAEPFYGGYAPVPYGGTPFLGPTPIIAPAPIDTKTQYHYQDDFGSGSYGHAEPTAYHHATHDAFGNKQGEFSYVKPDGTIHKTRYIADSEGYRVLSNDLPVGPTTHTLRKRSIGCPYASTPIITPSGHLADTPEVAAAKSAHFLEHAKRGNYHIAAPNAVPYSAWSAPAFQHEQHISSAHPYTSWPSSVSAWPSVVQSGHPTITSDGYLKETPEVAQATAAHLAEKLKLSKYSWNGDDYVDKTTPFYYNSGYAAPAYSGYTSISPEGQVTDTPEVVAAKAAHFAEHSAALARTAGTVGGHHVPYYAPAAYVQPSGVPADTPEVAQAKAAHFAEYVRVANRQKRSIPIGTFPASTLPLSLAVHPVVPSPALLPHPLPYSFARSHHLSSVIHAPFASSYQVVA